jgi:hypothetical protein
MLENKTNQKVSSRYKSKIFRLLEPWLSFNQLVLCQALLVFFSKVAVPHYYMLYTEPSASS